MDSGGGGDLVESRLMSLPNVDIVVGLGDSGTLSRRSYGSEGMAILPRRRCGDGCGADGNSGVN